MTEPNSLCVAGVVGQFEFQVLAMPGLTVIPAEAGIQILFLDPGLRRGDEIKAFVGLNDLELTDYRGRTNLDWAVRIVLY